MSDWMSGPHRAQRTVPLDAVAEPEPAEVTEPLDVVAWLRALPVGTVLLDSDGDAWQLTAQTNWWGEFDHAAFMCIDNVIRARLDDETMLSSLAEWAPFRVLYVPPGGAT